jgi:hypothetical protein
VTPRRQSRQEEAGIVAIARGHRFAIDFDGAFPQGLVLIGDVTPDNEYQTREEKAAVDRCGKKLTS